MTSPNKIKANWIISYIKLDQKKINFYILIKEKPIFVNRIKKECVMVI